MSGSLLEKCMRLAVREAEESLREGNHGFGAVLLEGDRILCREHDTDETDRDPAAHAELKAIRKGSALLGKDLSPCTLISTHEPCPMCSGAIVWSGIRRVVYGFGILDAIVQGRDRIRLTCEELFARSGAPIAVEKDFLKAECAVLYRKDVRREVKRLRNASEGELAEHCRQTAGKRIAWCRDRRLPAGAKGSDPLETAYRLVLQKLGIDEADAPVIHRDGGKIVFHSRNFCPTLEACRILGLDTRRVCRLYNEMATDALVKQVDPRLRFSRNYEKIRPYSESCEEIIEYGEPE